MKLKTSEERIMKNRKKFYNGIMQRHIFREAIYTLIGLSYKNQTHRRIICFLYGKFSTKIVTLQLEYKYMTKVEDILKIKATLLYIAGKFDKGVDYIKLFKLLYLAQKAHLSKYGRPIVNDDFYAMKAGPAPSVMYNICKVADGERSEQDLEDTARSISVQTKKMPKGNDVKYVTVCESPDMDELSTSDIECIDEIYAKYGKLTSSKLSTITHDSAWKKNWDEEKAEGQKIGLLDIASAAGVNESMMKYIQENLMLNGIVC